MDRAAIARAQRRRQALEALELERNRVAALEEQLETLVSELEGAGIDEAAFAQMTREDVEIVKGILEPGGLEGLDEELFELTGEMPDEGLDEQSEREEQEAEILRLEQEIAASHRRREAFERYLRALGE